LSDLDVTFSHQAELWLRELATRKRKPVAPSTLRVFGSYLRRLAPMIGDMKLAEINNAVLRELVQKLDAEKLSAKTINELAAVVKQVVGSVVDQDGSKVYRREWNHNFIDMPVVSNQSQPCVTANDVERCIKDAASDQERILYAVLAATGLRIAETLSIHVNGREDQTSWNPERQAIDVRSSIFNSQEICRLKTAAAKRTVDLDPGLNDLIVRYVEIKRIQPGDYLLQARSGRSMHLKTARERLAKHGIPGFHSFRRYRITRLRELGVPEDIVRFWVGHEGQSITDRYSKLSENVELRRTWSRREDLLGFELPRFAKSGHPEPQHDLPRRPREPATAPSSVELAEPPIVALAEPASPHYNAQPEDLDPFFYQGV